MTQPPEPTASQESEGVLGWLSRRLNLTEIFSVLTSFGIFYAELDSRKPLPEALAEVRAMPMPSYGRWPRVLGLMVVVLLALEILTGGLLALYYLPTPQTAHASLGTIVREVAFGSLVRQIHFWGAQVLLAILAVRLVRFLLQRVYRPPHELVWVLAALLLLVCFHADLTGRVLPFSATAYWSSVRALETFGAIPVYGAVMGFLLGGSGSFISDLTLIRSYILHVAALPALAVVLIYLHFSTVRRVGLSPVAGEERRTGEVGLPQHLLNLALVLALLFGLLVTLAVLAPRPFQAEADPYATVPGVGPPWYLLAPFGFLEWTSGVMPQWLAGAVLFLAFTAFVALPFLEGKRPRRRRWLVLAAAALLLVAWVLLTLHGARVA